MAKAQRPLSPHLQIYRWYLSMALSIAHRASGIVLSGGLVLLTWWLVAMARGPEAFATVQGVVGSWFGALVLFGLTYVAFHHLASGVRHLAFDAGYGFGPEQAYRSGLVVIGVAAGLTFLTWLAFLIIG
jgi:succinate dehydrogenase / fumarate reductase, cytochrome b subunit